MSVGLPVLARFHVATEDVHAARVAAADVLSAARVYARALDDAHAGSPLDDELAARLESAQGRLLDASLDYSGAAQVAALQARDSLARDRAHFGVRP